MARSPFLTGWIFSTSLHALAFASALWALADTQRPHEHEAEILHVTLSEMSGLAGPQAQRVEAVPSPEQKLEVSTTPVPPERILRSNPLKRTVVTRKVQLARVETSVQVQRIEATRLIVKQDNELGKVIESRVAARRVDQRFPRVTERNVDGSVRSLSPVQPARPQSEAMQPRVIERATVVQVEDAVSAGVTAMQVEPVQGRGTGVERKPSEGMVGSKTLPVASIVHELSRPQMRTQQAAGRGVATSPASPKVQDASMADRREDAVPMVRILDHQPDTSATRAASDSDSPMVVARTPPVLRASYGWLARAMHRSIAALKQYPKAARAQHWEGKVLLRAVIKEDGHLAELSVRRSSGHDLLDQDAMSLVRQVCPVPLQHPLGRAQVVLHIPITYQLGN